jgi:hypothetical protein
MSLTLMGTDGIFDEREYDPQYVINDIARILKKTRKAIKREKTETKALRAFINSAVRPVDQPRPPRRAQPAQKAISILGVRTPYQNVPQLAKTLKIGATFKERRANARLAMKNINTPKVIHNIKSGLFSPLDLRAPPLLIRQFTGIRKIGDKMKNRLLTKGRYNYAPPQDPTEGVQIFDKSKPFSRYDRLALYYDVTFRFIYSNSDGTYKHRSVRTLSDVYYGNVGNRNHLREGFIMKNENPDGMADFSYHYNPERLKKNASGATVLAYAQASLQDPDVDNNSIGNLHMAVIAHISGLYDFAHWIILDRVVIRTADQRYAFNLQKMRLQAVAYDNIQANLYNEVVDIDNKNENCVTAYLTKYYEKIDIADYFKDIDTTNGIDTEQIIDFCKHHKIKCIAYDIELNVIMSHFPDIKKKQHKSLIYIAYNNHIYPVNNKSLHKVTPFQSTVGKDNTKSDSAKLKPKDRPKELCRYNQGKMNKTFKALLAQKIIPSHITINSEMSNLDDHDMDELNVKSYAHDNVFYFVNDDYDDILKLLTLYGVQDKMTPFTTMYNVMPILEELYGVGNMFSFAPHLKDIKMQGYMYHVDHIPTPEEEKQFMTLDKKKAYPYALSQLKFIQTMDTRTCKVVENPTEIIDTWAYIARPHACSLLMHGTNYYDGEHLLFCRNRGLQFDLLYGFETKVHTNPFIALIDDYYGKTEDVKFNDDRIVKDILNVWIGKMEKGCGTVSRHTRLRKICNMDEATKTQGTTLKYDDTTALCFDEDEHADIYTRKPISFQIKNMARRVLFEKMDSLDIANDDVIQICVDSVTFVNKNNITYTNDNTYKGWKHDKYSRIGLSSYERCTNDILKLVTPPPRNNVLYEAYAGHGKTHWIKNTLIPKLIAKNESYIVLSPSHSTIKEYRTDNLCCDVIQKYEHHDLPTADVIIVDEIGFCGKKPNDTIYRLMVLGRKIFSFGDFNQLLPVNEEAHFNNKIYLDTVYRNICSFKKNHRNDFTKAYYDDLINVKVDVIEEIKKHNEKDPLKADIIVCHRNETRKKMNEMIMKKKGIKFGSLGCKVMCKVNKFRDMDIYNNFEFVVTDVNDTHITLDGKYELTVKQFFGGTEDAPHFVPAYARTMYNMQGDSCKSYHIPTDEIKYFNNGRFAYTLISRLKTK